MTFKELTVAIATKRNIQQLDVQMVLEELSRMVAAADPGQRICLPLGHFVVEIGGARAARSIRSIKTGEMIALPPIPARRIVKFKTRNSEPEAEVGF